MHNCRTGTSGLRKSKLLLRQFRIENASLYIAAGRGRPAYKSHINNKTMKEQITTSHLFITFSTLIFSLVFIAFSYQQAELETGEPLEASIQNEGVVLELFDTFNSWGFDILEGPLTETGAEMLPESPILEACYEQLGVFILPASDAEPFLPEGFKPLQPEGFEPENVDLSGEYAPLNVWSIECEPVHEKEEPLNMVWMDISVVPPEAYRSDDIDVFSVPVKLFTSSPTLVEILHSFGIPQTELSDVTHEVNEKADTVRTGLAHATGGGEEITMETHVAGTPIPEEGFEARIFGVEDGQVTGVVDLIISDFDIMPGEASLTENTLFSEQSLESAYNVHAWEIEFHLEPVEHW